jgi:hypothetical protein
MGICQNFVSSRGWRRERRKCIAYEDLVPINSDSLHLTVYLHTTPLPKQKTSKQQELLRMAVIYVIQEVGRIYQPSNPSKIIKSLQ